MRLSFARYAIAASLIIVAASTAGAQQQHQHGGAQKQDSAAMKGHDMKGHDMKGADMKGHDMKGHSMSQWKEMDAFHATLAATYHPAAEKDDFAPLKAKAADLSAQARTWAASTAPASCATGDTKGAVDALAASTAALADQVSKGATESDLKAAITAIHEKFETVEHGCMPKHEMKR